MMATTLPFTNTMIKTHACIGNDIIRTCMTDKQGQIWIGTDEGLSLYDVNMDRFENFSYIQNGKQMSIDGIVEVNNKLLLCSRKKKLLCLIWKPCSTLKNYLFRHFSPLYLSLSIGKMIVSI